LSYKQKSPLPVAEGGTNTSSFPFDHGVLIFEAGQQISINPGLANQVLTSNGPATPPTFQSNPADGIVTLDADTGSATGGTVSIVGGSNLNTFASASSLTVELVNSPSVSGSVTSGAGFIATTGGINFTNFTEGALITSVIGVTSTVTGAAGTILTANAAGTAPSFQAAPSSSISITGDTGGALTGVAFTFTGGTTGLSFGGSGSTETLSGTLVVGNGGTGVTSVTTSPTATSFAGWDANSNLSANSFVPGYTTTATAGATTTLTVASTFHQFFTGTLSQTVVLPVTSTLALGQQYQINNNSSAAITVTSSGSNNVQIMAPLSQIEVTCILTSGTTAASWDSVYNPGFSLYPTAGALVTNSSGVISDATGTSGYVLTSTGAVTAPTFQAVPSSGFTWNNVTGASQAMAVGNGYIGNDGASLVTMTLPATAAIGSIVAAQGNGTGLWKIAQNASQSISFNGGTSTVGATGFIASTSQYDSVTLICTVVNNGWVANQSMGNITVS